MRTRKILAILLALCMILPLFPTMMSTAEDGAGVEDLELNAGLVNDIALTYHSYRSTGSYIIYYKLTGNIGLKEALPATDITLLEDMGVDPYESWSVFDDEGVPKSPYNHTAIGINLKEFLLGLEDFNFEETDGITIIQTNPALSLFSDSAEKYPGNVKNKIYKLGDIDNVFSILVQDGNSLQDGSNVMLGIYNYTKDETVDIYIYNDLVFDEYAKVTTTPEFNVYDPSKTKGPFYDVYYIASELDSYSLTLNLNVGTVAFSTNSPYISVDAATGKVVFLDPDDKYAWEVGALPVVTATIGTETINIRLFPTARYDVTINGGGRVDVYDNDTTYGALGYVSCTAKNSSVNTCFGAGYLNQVKAYADPGWKVASFTITGGLDWDLWEHLEPADILPFTRAWTTKYEATSAIYTVEVTFEELDYGIDARMVDYYDGNDDMEWNQTNVKLEKTIVGDVYVLTITGEDRLEKYESNSSEQNDADYYWLGILIDVVDYRYIELGDGTYHPITVGDFLEAKDCGGIGNEIVYWIKVNDDDATDALNNRTIKLATTNDGDGDEAIMNIIFVPFDDGCQCGSCAECPICGKCTCTSTDCTCEKCPGSHVGTPEIESLAVVDGIEGWGPYSLTPGSKLLCNINTTSGTIGGSPVSTYAHYIWYYGDDTFLGSDPYFTITSDIIGKTISLEVWVEDYNYDGSASSATNTIKWTATGPVVDESDIGDPVWTTQFGELKANAPYIKDWRGYCDCGDDCEYWCEGECTCGWNDVGVYYIKDTLVDKKYLTLDLSDKLNISSGPEDISGKVNVDWIYWDNDEWDWVPLVDNGDGTCTIDVIKGINEIVAILSTEDPNGIVEDYLWIYPIPVAQWNLDIDGNCSLWYFRTNTNIIAVDYLDDDGWEWYDNGSIHSGYGFTSMNLLTLVDEGEVTPYVEMNIYNWSDYGKFTTFTVTPVKVVGEEDGEDIYNVNIYGSDDDKYADVYPVESIVYTVTAVFEEVEYKYGLDKPITGEKTVEIKNSGATPNDEEFKFQIKLLGTEYYGYYWTIEEELKAWNDEYGTNAKTLNEFFGDDLYEYTKILPYSKMTNNKGTFGFDLAKFFETNLFGAYSWSNFIFEVSELPGTNTTDWDYAANKYLVRVYREYEYYDGPVVGAEGSLITAATIEEPVTYYWEIITLEDGEYKCECEKFYVCSCDECDCDCDDCVEDECDCLKLVCGECGEGCECDATFKYFEVVEDGAIAFKNTYKGTAVIPDPDLISYTIRYDANGGSGTIPASVSGTVAKSGDEATTLVKGQGGLFREGYLFVGWSFGGVTYGDGDRLNVRIYVDDTVITLTAVWQPVGGPSPTNPTRPTTSGEIITTIGEDPTDPTGSTEPTIETTQPTIDVVEPTEPPVNVIIPTEPTIVEPITIPATIEVDDEIALDDEGNPLSGWIWNEELGRWELWENGVLIEFRYDTPDEVAEEINNPKTGDIMLPGMLLAMLTTVAIGVVVFRKKRNGTN